MTTPSSDQEPPTMPRRYNSDLTAITVDKARAVVDHLKEQHAAILRRALTPETTTDVVAITDAIEVINRLCNRLMRYEDIHGKPNFTVVQSSGGSGGGRAKTFVVAGGGGIPGHGLIPPPPIPLITDRSDHLAALPHHAVILDDDGEAWQKSRADTNPDEDAWELVGTDDSPTSSHKLEHSRFGPFRIIHPLEQDPTQ